MNIIKAQDLLKGADDQTLERYLANPTGEFPEYLVASEKMRRDDLRKRYAAEMEGKPSKSSIIEELIQKAGLGPQPAPQQLPQEMPPQMMGIGAVPPPPDMQMTPPPMLAAAAQAPQQMYDGGVVALAEGGSMSDAIEEYLRPRAMGNESGYNIGVSPSIPVGEGSLDIDAGTMGAGKYKNYHGRLGASYPVGEGNISAGVSGVADQYRQGVTGYDVGYEDPRNRARLNIIPTDMGNQYRGEYVRQLGDDSELAIRAALGNMPRVPVNDYRQAPLSVEYTKRFDKGGLASEVSDYLSGNYAQGGIIGYAGPQGSMVDLSAFDIPEDLYDYGPVEKPREMSYYTDVAKSELGPSGLEGYESALQQQRDVLEKRKKNYLPNFLIQAGLGMATSKNLSPLGAAAEGAAKGFEFYQESKKADEAADRQIQDAQFKFQQAQRAERAGVFGLSQQLYNNAMSQYNVGVDNRRQGAALKMQSANYRQEALDRARHYDLNEKQLNLATENAVVERQAKRLSMDLTRQKIENAKEVRKLKGQPKPMTGKEKADLIFNLMEKEPYQDFVAQLDEQIKKYPNLRYSRQQKIDEWLDKQIRKYSDVYTEADVAQATN